MTAATIQEEGQEQQKEYIKVKTKVKDLYVKSPVVVRAWDSRFQLKVDYTIGEETARRHISLYNQSVLRKRYKLWFDIYKRDFKCVICKNGDKEVLDFHHLDPKIKNHSISTMICGCMKLQDIQAELKKCITVCLHYHRKIENRSISKDEVMEKAKKEYRIPKNPRPGENILEDFPTMMLTFPGFTIVYRYDVHSIKNATCKIDLTLEQRPIFCIVVDPATFKGELRCVPLMPAGDVAVCVIFIEEDHFSVTSPCELPMIQIQGQSVKCFSRFF